MRFLSDPLTQAAYYPLPDLYLPVCSVAVLFLFFLLDFFLYVVFLSNKEVRSSNCVAGTILEVISLA